MAPKCHGGTTLSNTSPQFLKQPVCVFRKLCCTSRLMLGWFENDFGELTHLSYHHSRIAPSTRERQNGGLGSDRLGWVFKMRDGNNTCRVF